MKKQGKIFSNPLKKAKILANQFKSVFRIDDQNAHDKYLYGPSIPPIPDIEFSTPGVAKLLKGLDSKKASGPDQIPCCLLYEELSPVFTPYTGLLIIRVKFHLSGSLLGQLPFLRRVLNATLLTMSREPYVRGLQATCTHHMLQNLQTSGQTSGPIPKSTWIL